MPRKFLRRILPNFHHIREHRWLAWLGPSLHHPRIWHVSREGIALGAAIGVFFGMLVPVAQMPLAAILAIVLRANLPMAAAGTLITNPFTVPPLYYIAYLIGSAITGDPASAFSASSVESDPTQFAGWFDVWSERLLRLGKPLMIGLFVMACVLSVLCYFSIHWIWRALTVRAWRKRGKSGADPRL